MNFTIILPALFISLAAAPAQADDTPIPPARHWDKRGDIIDKRLDERGHRIDERLDQWGERVQLRRRDR